MFYNSMETMGFTMETFYEKPSKIRLRKSPWFHLVPPGLSKEDVEGLLTQCLADSSSDVVMLTLESLPGMQFLVHQTWPTWKNPKMGRL